MAEIDCLGCSVDTKDITIEILHFKQFYKHFVFEKDEEGYVKKTQKNYVDVRVVLRLVLGKELARLTSYCGNRYYFVATKTCLVRAITKERLTKTGLFDPYDYYISRSCVNCMPSGMYGGVRGLFI